MSASSKYLTESDWLDARKHSLGASEAATAMGLSPYMSQYALWHSKVHRSDFCGNIMTRAGQHMEQFIADEYAKETGEVLENEGLKIYRNDLVPFLHATPDRLIKSRPGIVPLEIKFSSRGAGWSSDVPPLAYRIQVQIQMYCMGVRSAVICGFVGGMLRIFEEERSEDLIGIVLLELEKFWYYVTTQTPPPIDGSESTTRIMRAIKEQSGTIDLGPVGAALCERRATLKGEVKEIEAALNETENRIRALVGENSEAECGGYHVSLKTATRKGALIVPVEYADELGEIGICYRTQESTAYRTLRIKENNE